MKTLQRIVSAFMVLEMLIAPVNMALAGGFESTPGVVAPGSQTDFEGNPTNLGSQSAGIGSSPTTRPAASPTSASASAVPDTCGSTSDCNSASSLANKQASLDAIEKSVAESLQPIYDTCFPLTGITNHPNLKLTAAEQKTIKDTHTSTFDRTKRISGNMASSRSSMSSMCSKFHEACLNAKNSAVAESSCQGATSYATSANQQCTAASSDADGGQRDISHLRQLLLDAEGRLFREISSASADTNPQVQTAFNGVKAQVEQCKNLLHTAASKTDQKQNNLAVADESFADLKANADRDVASTQAIGGSGGSAGKCFMAFNATQGVGPGGKPIPPITPTGSPDGSGGGGMSLGTLAMGAAVLGGIGALGYMLGKGSGDSGGSKDKNNNVSTTGTVTCPAGQYLAGSVCLTSPTALTDGVANGTDSGTSATTTTAAGANLGTAQNLTGGNTLGNGNPGSNGTAAGTRGAGASGVAVGSSGSSGSGSLGLTGGGGGGAGGTAATTRGLVASTGPSGALGGGYGGGFGGGAGAGSGDQAAQGGMSLNSVDPGSGGTRVRVWKMVNGKMQWVWEVKGGCQAMKSCNDRRSRILSEASGTPAQAPNTAPATATRGLTANNIVNRSPASVSRTPATTTKVQPKKKVVKKPLIQQDR